MDPFGSGGADWEAMLILMDPETAPAGSGMSHGCGSIRGRHIDCRRRQVHARSRSRRRVWAQSDWVACLDY